MPNIYETGRQHLGARLPDEDINGFQPQPPQVDATDVLEGEAVLVGNRFARRVILYKHECGTDKIGKTLLRKWRRVKITVARNPIQGTQEIFPSSFGATTEIFPHRHLGLSDVFIIIRPEEALRQLATVRKRGASRRNPVNMDEAWQKRGGDPTNPSFKITKLRGGFSSSTLANSYKRQIEPLEAPVAENTPDVSSIEIPW